jgi:hypothetical protein
MLESHSLFLYPADGEIVYDKQGEMGICFLHWNDNNSDCGHGSKAGGFERSQLRPETKPRKRERQREEEDPGRKRVRVLQVERATEKERRRGQHPLQP